MAYTIDGRMAGEASSELDVAEVYDAHADFVWRSLHRLGVRTADLPDLLQEVFVVVHRRRADYRPERPIRGWLWGISVGLARNYRRRAHRNAERLRGRVPERPSQDDPQGALDARRRRERGRRMLESLDPEKRAVFVMFEVEGLSGHRIAQLLDVPLGTVHSRLHAARRALTEALAGQEEA